LMLWGRFKIGTLYRSRDLQCEIRKCIIIVLAACGSAICYPLQTYTSNYWRYLPKCCHNLICTMNLFYFTENHHFNSGE
jgi:hypothetical protein